MSNFRGKGYLIPDVIDPGEYLCLKVYIPAHVDHLLAFSGQFHELGKWLIWDKDKSGSAAETARVWKDAIDYTYENGWIGNCGGSWCDDMTEDEFKQWLNEVLDMNINVNCGGGCGCGCGCGDASQVPGDDYQTPYPNPPYEPNPSGEDGLNWKCGMANYLMYVLRLTGMQSVTWDGTFQDWTKGWDNYFGFWDDGDYETFFYYPYTAVLSLINGVANTEVITVPFDESYNAMVCAIYSAQTPKAASDAVMDMIKSTYGDLVVRHLMTEIASQLPWSLPFSPGDVSSMPPGFSGRDCSTCLGQGIDWPENTSEYEWRVGSSAQEVVASQYTTGTVFRSDGLDWDFTVTINNATWAPTVSFTPPVLAPGEEIVGYTYYLVETESSGGIQDPADDTVQVNGDRLPGNWRKLWWLTGYSDIQSLGSFDYTNEDSQTDMAQDRDFVGYARIGTSGNPPGSGHVKISAILWCVKLA